jgi:hypothetical protein
VAGKAGHTRPKQKIYRGGWAALLIGNNFVIR